MQIWADAYIGEARFNATEAGRIAGYANPRRSGQDNRKNPLVQAYIKETLEQSAVSRDEILKLVGEEARKSDSDILELTAQHGSEIVQSSLVSSMASARTAARTNLMKAHGLFTENINVSGSIRREIVIVDPDDE